MAIVDRHVVLAREGAYHGNSRGALDASDRLGSASGLRTVAGPDGPGADGEPVPRRTRTGAEHAAELDRIIRDTGPERVAALIAEPISGATLGAVVPPDDYWPADRTRCAAITACC